MASLTPGVLSKLLQNIHNADVKVAGEHRSSLLQVIGILPALADVDPWKHKGFYLRVSDSVHSAYVSVTEDDVDLILSDKIQLGQFIHVSCLDSGSPVPVLRGVKPVPKRRQPCVGDPKDLISSDSLQIRNHSVVDFLKKTNGGSRRVSLGNGGKIEGLEKRRLSLDSSRKGWDRSPPVPKNGVSTSKSKQTKSSSICSTPSRSNRKASSEKDLTLKQPNLNIAPLKNKNVIISEKLMTKPIQKDLKSSFDCTIIPSHLNKVPLSLKSWSGSKILWDNVSPAIHDLGKEVMCRRNVGFFSAVHALEETSAADGILQCMSIFADLCESAQRDLTNPLVEQFLNLYQSIQRASGTINTLLDTRLTDEKSSNHYRSESSLPEMCKNLKNKNAAFWVQGALETNLSKFSLFTKEDLHCDKSHYLVLENTSEKKIQVVNCLPENKQSPKNLVSDSGTKKIPIRSRQRLSVTKKTTLEREEWSKGNGLNQAASLAEKLLSTSRAWFLNYLEDSLNKGLGLKKGEENSEVAGLLGQLKRVNQWLDDLVGDGIGVNERVESLRKKLYVFLLDHVGS